MLFSNNWRDEECEQNDDEEESEDDESAEQINLGDVRTYNYTFENIMLMEKKGKLKDAEKLFVKINEPDLAINMYKKSTNFRFFLFVAV